MADWTRDQLVALSNRVADETGIPRALLLACAVAESSLSVTAERWGDRTGDAQIAIVRADWSALAGVMVDLQARKLSDDISFGLCQQSWLYAPGESDDYTVDNLMRIRARYFEPEHALRTAAEQLKVRLAQAGGESDDAALLAALYRYNWPAGSGKPYSQDHERNYTRGLAEAKALLAAAPAPAPSPPPADDIAAKLARVLAAGRPLIGQGYVWGGKSPSTGMDCSGFVAWCYSTIRVVLPSFTDAIYGATDPIDPAAALPGDIVLFQYSDPAQPGVRFPHVGLYAGGNNLLDDSASRGVSERPIPDIGTRYWRRARGLATAVPGTHRIIGTGPEGLNLRDAPSTTARVLATIPDGATVRSTGLAWRPVEWQGRDGWVADEWLEEV